MKKTKAKKIKLNPDTAWQMSFWLLSIAYKYAKYMAIDKNKSLGSKAKKLNTQNLNSTEKLLLDIRETFKTVQKKKTNDLQIKNRVTLLKELNNIYVAFNNKKISSIEKLEDIVLDLMSLFYPSEYIQEQLDIIKPLYTFEATDLSKGKIKEPKNKAEVNLAAFFKKKDKTPQSWERKSKKSHFDFDKYDLFFLELSLVNIFDVDQKTASRIAKEISSSESYKKKIKNHWGRIEVGI